MNKPVSLFVFLLLTFGILAQDSNTIPAEDQQFIPISGSLPEVVTQQSKPYLVTSSIEVPPGKTVTIEKGVVFLFKNFTGLHVKGTLWAHGTVSDPVVFTSENHKKYNTTSAFDPAPFDWDGITIEQNEAKSVFEHAVVEFSLFGIKSVADNIILKECTFNQNGNVDFSINGEEQVITSFSYNYQSEAIAEASTDKEKKEKKEKKKKDEKKAPKEKKEEKVSLVEQNENEKQSDSNKKGLKISFNVLSIGAVVCGGAFGLWETKKYLDSKKAFDKINTVTHENKMTKDIAKQWETYKNDTNMHLTYMSTGYGVALLGIGLFTLTLTF